MWPVFDKLQCTLSCSSFILQVVVKEPCVFAVENAHFIDHQSWNFLEDLVRDSHAVLVMTMKPLNKETLPDSAKRLVEDIKTVKVTLGVYKNLLRRFYGKHQYFVRSSLCRVISFKFFRDIERSVALWNRKESVGG